MLITRCTAKLLKELGVKDNNQVDNVRDGEFLGIWYSDLLRIERRKCLLFVNEETLYSFLVLGVRKTDYEDFGLFFRAHLMLNLKYEGFDDSVIGKAMKGYDSFIFTKTMSRSVLGSMNDYSEQYKHYIACYGGIQNTDLMAINQKVNETPMSAIGYDKGIKRMRLALSQLNASCA